MLSKYNVLPSKDETSRKSDSAGSVKKTSNESNFEDADYGVENLKKIDITLAEASDQSESSASFTSESLLKNANCDVVKEINGNVFTIDRSKTRDLHHFLSLRGWSQE